MLCIGPGVCHMHMNGSACYIWNRSSGRHIHPVIFLSTFIPTSSTYNKPHILLTSLVVSSNFSIDSLLSRYVLQISTNDKFATSGLIVYIYNFFFLSPGWLSQVYNFSQSKHSYHTFDLNGNVSRVSQNMRLVWWDCMFRIKQQK